MCLNYEGFLGIAQKMLKGGRGYSTTLTILYNNLNISQLSLIKLMMDSSFSFYYNMYAYINYI